MGGKDKDLNPGSRERRHLFSRSKAVHGSGEEKDDPPTEVLPQIHLECFTTTAALPDSDLGQTQDDLREAMERLESVLQTLGRSSAEDMPHLTEEMETLSSTDPPKSLTAVTRAIQSDRSQSEKSFGAKVGRFFQKIFPVTKFTLGITGDAASYAAFQPLQITANGLNQVFELAMNPLTQDELVKGGLDTIAGDDAFLRELERFPTSMLRAFMLRSAIKLQTALVVFLRTSILWLRKAYFRKFIDGVVGRQQVEDAIQGLEKARSDLLRSAVLETNLVILRQGLLLQEAELLRNICTDDFLNAQIDRQDKLHNDRAAETGGWLLCHEAFSRFVSGTISVLWCPGAAGAGKSFLSSVIVDHLESYAQQQDVTVAYVYFKRERWQQQSTESLLGAIIRQLLARDSDLCSEFKDRLKRRNMSKELRQEILKLIIAKSKQTVIVLDALDEFAQDHSNRTALMKVLVAIAKELKPNQFRMLVTSREAPDVWQHIQTQLPLHADIRITAAAFDIARMVEKTIGDIPEAEELMGKELDESTLKDYTVKKIVEKSDGVFRLAEFQLKRTLREGSTLEVIDCLESLSADLNDYYSDSLERVESNPKSQLLRQMLTWVYHAKVPLHLRELAFAVGIKGLAIDPKKIPHMVVSRLDVFISQLEGLVTTTPTTNHSKGPAVSFSHATVSDYLQDHPNVLLPDGSAMIENACIAILSCEPFSGILANMLSFDWQDSSDRIGRKRQAQFDRLRKSRQEELGLKGAEEAASFAIWACNIPNWLPLDRLGGTDPDDGLIKFLHTVSELRSPEDDFSEPMDWFVYNDWHTLCDWFVRQNIAGDIEQCGPELLDVAILYASLRTAEVLAASPSIDINHAVNQSPPLMMTVEWNVPSVTEILVRRSDLEINAKSDTKANGNQTALHEASKEKNVVILAVLLTHEQIEVNARNKSGITPLIFALLWQPKVDRWKSTAIIRLLLARKDILVDVRDNTGKTALSVAAGGGFRFTSHYRLLKTRNPTKAYQIIQEFHEYFEQDFVSQLLEAGAKRDIVDKKGRYPLDHASALCDIIDELASCAKRLWKRPVEGGSRIGRQALSISAPDPALDDTQRMARLVVERLKGQDAPTNTGGDVGDV